MAIRKTTHVTKNSDIVNRPLPSSGLLAGEAIVNTSEGILWYSGVTTSTDEWVSAGTGATADYFEVGSNLYDLAIRNKLTKYQDISGAGLNGKFLSGTTTGFVLADISDISSATDSYSTGGTYSSITDEITIELNLGRPSVVITGITDTFTTGSTLIGSTLHFDTNDTLSAYTANLSTLDTSDTFVTGMTLASSVLTLERNEGAADLTTIIDTLTGLTVTNLTAGRVTYAGTGGLLTDEAGFTYDDTLNILSTPTDGSVVVGTGGLEVGSGGSIGTPGVGSVVIHGDLTVFGAAISAFTNELFVEDPTISLNYNPTGSTTSTSIGSGWLIQDGNGLTSGDVNLEIRPMDAFTGLTAGNVPDITEYGGSTGYSNRAWVTQLNDIVIRSTSAGTPNGVRVITEFDVLSGGIY
jgi:hypothetical protein